ncbi:MBL fold metallo-hydrolase RNA specificity domain-containing protein [Streptomyces hyaluromycini]|uniref:MBL fold metallo-hydrolase RNA specificity domain-containing protein n=1 Tax=Streptomyces hyaluromycini TaxID=1377993 RepID=A0ABV1XG28_9ACTN
MDGAKVLKMFGGYVPVRAAIADVPHFSAHADATQITGWLRGPRAAGDLPGLRLTRSPGALGRLYPLHGLHLLGGDVVCSL